MSARFVPAIHGIPSVRPSPLWGAYLLVNAGCATRVFVQTLTDWYPTAYAIVGVSAVFEIAGLT